MLRDVKTIISDGLLGFATATGDGLSVKIGASPVVSDTPSRPSEIDRKSVV